MQRLAAIIFLTAMFASSISLVGCSMCCGPDDLNYPTYGGLHQRADPAYGRVGSVFSDPYAHAGGPSADSNLEPYPEPRATQDFGEDEDDLDDLDDIEREDEDLDDDLENLDREDLEREDLERIDPLDDDELEIEGARENTTTARRPRWRRSRR